MTRTRRPGSPARWLGLHLVAVLVLASAPTSASARSCTLIELASAEGAKLKVYFTQFLKEDRSEGRYRTCRRVRRAEPDTIPFFVTPFREDADLVVHRDNWPG